MCWGSFATTENNWGMQQNLAFTVLIKYWLYALGQSSARSLFKFLSGKSCSASVWGSCNSTIHVEDGSHEGTFPSRAETCFDSALIFLQRPQGSSSLQLLCFTFEMSFHWMSLSAGDSSLCLRCDIADHFPLCWGFWAPWTSPAAQELPQCGFHCSYKLG